MTIERGLVMHIFSFVFAVLLLAGFAAAGSVSVDSALIKFSMKEGEYMTKSFVVSSSQQSTVSLKATNLKGVSLSEEMPIMDAGDSRSILVLVDSSALKPGVYAGYISVNSIDTLIHVPIIIEVESKDVFFDANIEIPPLYADVEPGKNMIAQINMFDLTDATQKGLSPASVDVEYFVFNNKGETVVSESESLVVNKNSGVSKSLKIPADAEEGIYVAAVLVKYGESVGVSSNVFRVSYSKPNPNAKPVDFSLNWLKTLAWVVVIIFLFMVSFILFVKDRDKFMDSLRRYHDIEMRKQKQFLIEQECIVKNKKGVSLKNLKSEVNSKIQDLKTKQRKRIKELERLKEVGDESAMERKLNEWKNKGYNTLLLESKLEGLNSKEMKQIMARWKKKGYLLK